MTDIVIIGAGTAGLSAAIYALRAGKSVLLMEQGSGRRAQIRAGHRHRGRRSQEGKDKRRRVRVQGHYSGYRRKEQTAWP